MSVWYQCKIYAIAANTAAIAKFFNLPDSYEFVRTDGFEFSFGGKNAPSLNVRKILEQNPDLIFLCKQSVECSTVQWFLMKYDAETSVQKIIFIQDSGEYNNEINKKILEEYTKEFPNLPAKHYVKEKGYEEFRWAMFFNTFEKANAMLNKSEQYKEMICNIPTSQEDMEFDNLPLEEYK